MADIAELEAENEHLKFLLSEMTTPVEDYGMHLSRAQTIIFGMLSRSPDKTKPKDSLIRAIYPDGDEPETVDNVLKVHVHNIRKKLVASGADVHIRTVWGVGYRLVTGKQDAWQASSYE